MRKALLSEFDTGTTRGSWGYVWDFGAVPCLCPVCYSHMPSNRLFLPCPGLLICAEVLTKNKLLTHAHTLGM